MTIIYCKDCGHLLKATDAACPKCGSKSRDILSEDWGYGKEEAKVFVVEFQEKIGLKSTVDAAVKQALSKEERGLWKRLTSWLQETLEIDDFSVGFPSGVKVKFKLKEQPKGE